MLVCSGLELIMFGWDTLCGGLGCIGSGWGLLACGGVAVSVRSWEAPELDLRSRRGTTPLYIASAGGNMVVVDMLLKARIGTQS